MWKADNLKILQRKLKNNESVDKYIRKLRNANNLDILLSFDAKKRTLLMHFVENGNLTQVVSLLQGVNPPSTTIIDHEQQNALNLAVFADEQGSQLAIIEELLKYNPTEQLLQKDVQGEIPLHMALNKGYLPLVKLLLRFCAKEQLLTKSLTQETAFVYAARSYNDPLIIYLVQSFPYILDEKTTDGYTPLHFAVQINYGTLVGCLLQKGFEGQELMGDNMNRLPLAVACAESDIKIVEKLLLKNAAAQLTHQDNLGNTIFINEKVLRRIKIFDLLIESAKKEKIDVKALLLQKNKMDLAAIHLLVSLPECDESVIILQKLLIIAGEEQLTFLGPLDSTPLALATISGNVRMVKILAQCQNQEQFLLKCKNGKIPLLAAALDDIEDSVKPLSVKSKEIIKILLQYGPGEQLNQTYHNVDIFSFIVMFKRSLEVLRLLLDSCTEQQLMIFQSQGFVALNAAVAHGAKDYVQVFVESKFIDIIVNIQDKELGTTPLHTAVKIDHYEMASLLIAHGARTNIRNHKGMTPIHGACFTGNLKMLTLLTDNEADVYMQTNVGITALDIAIVEDKGIIVKELLVKYQFLSHHKQLHHTTMFVVALRKITTFDLLVQHGVDLKVIVVHEGFHYSPLFLAVRARNFDMIIQLKENGGDINQKIHDNNSTIRDYIIDKYTSKPYIYNKFKKIFPQLPALNPLTDHALMLACEQQTAAIFTQYKPIKLRVYLAEQGFSKQTIDQLEIDRKNSKTMTIKWNVDEKKPKKIINFLNNKINSTHEAIIPIEGAGAEDHYCYLDIKSLKAQGCDLDELNAIRLKFDGQHIKKLDDDQGMHYDLIQLSPEDQPEQRKYTHELKVTKIDRIFMFQEGPLLIGIKYVPGGLHRQADTQALRASSKSQVTLQVQWPEDIVFTKIVRQLSLSM